jgi:hypothetical protein
VKMSRWVLWVYDLLSPLVLKNSNQGALTALYAATSHQVEERGITGAYIVPPGKVGGVASLAKDLYRQQALWEFSESFLQRRGFNIPPVD